MQVLQEFDLQLRYQKSKFNVLVDTLSLLLMVNKFNFTRFKSSLLESLKGLLEHDTSFLYIWFQIYVTRIDGEVALYLLELNSSLMI